MMIYNPNVDLKTVKTRIDVYETLCPQQMLVHKGGKIKSWGGECRDVTPTKSLSQNIRVDVNREVKFLLLFFLEGGGQVGAGSGWGRGQGGCEQRIEVFVKTQKKIWGESWGFGRWGEGGIGLGGVRVDVIEELKFLGKHTKKKFGGGVV